jgi:hypothetical protein
MQIFKHLRHKLSKIILNSPTNSISYIAKVTERGEGERERRRDGERGRAFTFWVRAVCYSLKKKRSI